MKGASGRLGRPRSDGLGAEGRRGGLTRRDLLRRGGASAAGGGLFAGLALPGAAAAGRTGGPPGASSLLVVLPLIRADYVGAFDGDSGTDTPNIDDLTGDSLRFDRTRSPSACRRCRCGARS